MNTISEEESKGIQSEGARGNLVTRGVEERKGEGREEKTMRDRTERKRGLSVAPTALNSCARRRLASARSRSVRCGVCSHTPPV